MFNRVVVGIKDFESDNDALGLGQALCSQGGALTLAHVQVGMSRPAPDSGATRRAATRRHAFERLAGLRDEWRLDADVVCAEAPSAREGLHELARARHSDLLVIGASRQDVLTREFVGDDTRDLLEEPPCAVAVAPRSHSERRTLRKIGVAYDDSPESHEALRVARSLATERNATLSAFHAVRVASQVRDPWDVRGQDAADTRDPIQDLGGLEAHVEYGDTVEELVGYGRSVDLLVLGSHKYGPLNRAFEQSTAQRLADEGSCPLLVLSDAN
jgi:nucleotide-binding universal stress UspA family protein